MIAPALSADQERKTFSEMAALAALNGWQLWRSHAADGPTRYFAGRWAQVRVLGDLDEVKRFLEQVGVKA